LTALNERSCILDLGCGISTVLHFLPGERWGIDPLGDRYRTIYRYPDGVRVSKGYGESIPFPDAHFDAVFCSNCIDHMTDSKQAVREVQRVLKPNGFFVLTCEVFSSDLGVRNEGHPHSLTRDSFFALLRDFEVLASWDSVWHGLQRYVTGSPPTEQREFIAVARRGAKAAEG
jgi:ubiquinone/menaquinone biosynthesis C-methylase UbiE